MTKSANSQRGEANIVIGGQLFLLRPSFDALVAAEEEIGSLFAMVERASEGSLTIAEMAALIWHCLPPETRPERSVVGNELLTMGLVEAAKPVRVIFGQVLKGSG